MRIYWEYFKYVNKHRLLAMFECFRLGLIWAGLTHDLSKYSIAEFGAYARWFKGPLGIKIDLNSCLTESERSQTLANKQAFNYAWLHHQRHNPHHWNYWCQPTRKGTIACLPMPRRFWLEMIADWCAMSIAFNNTVWDWYEANKDTMTLHPTTREDVECFIGGLKFIAETRAGAVK